LLPTTYLFVPGDRPDRFGKARSSGAGMVILDLEDAVGAGAKATARTHVLEAVDTDLIRACIRINGSESQWFEEDCRLLRRPGVAAVMLPKSEDIEALAAVRAACTPETELIPCVETARGLAAAPQLAACAQVSRLAFGSVDLQLDLGIEADETELLFARSQLVLASRLAGAAAPIDGVTLSVNDVERIRADALRSRRMGFGAKLCIHPAQVAAINAVFAPDERLVAWARGVLDTAAAAASGTSVFDGKMIDKPVIERARAILERAALEGN
jgi:citrate lyase subunit beta/citryl-CoA lyase